MYHRSLIFAAFLLLVSCGNDRNSDIKMVSNVPIKASAMQIEFADTAEPSDEYLAEIYNRSCNSCHSVDGAGAPLTGHIAEWERRISLRGESGLLQSTINGLDGMPAMGMCADCSPADFEALIKYMKSAK